jgi:hypothetical protein
MATIKTQRSKSGSRSVTAGLDFREAVGVCLDRLQHEVPFGSWTLSLLIGDDRVLLYRSGRNVRGTPQGSMPVSETICSRVTQDHIALTMSVDGDGCVSAPIRRSFDVGAYLGVALFRTGGERLGSLGSMEMRRKQAPRGPRQLRILAATGRWVVRLFEGEMRAVRKRRAEANRPLCSGESAHPGPFWLADDEWQRALQTEDGLRQSLSLPAAVLAVEFKDSVRLRAPDGSVSSPTQRRGDELLPLLFGRPCPSFGCIRERSLLVLIPECDRTTAKRIEVRARQILDARGIEARVCAHSARYDESLARAATCAAHAVRGPGQVPDMAPARRPLR